MSPTDNDNVNEASFTTLKAVTFYHRHLLLAARAKYISDVATSESELLMLVEEGVGVGDHAHMVDDVNL